MFEDYYGTPDLSLLQSLLAGEQGLPTAQPVEAVPVDAGQRLPTAQPVVAQAVPADERSALLASLPPEYLVGVDASALDLPTLRNLARSATALSYEQNAAKAGGLYALDNPADYYQAYGAVPISFTGTSGYYDKGVSGPSIDYLTPDANASYTLYSPRSGEVLATGSGAEGLVNLAQQANALNAEKGRKADWQLIKTPTEGGTPEVVGSNLFNSDLTTLGKIVATGLPIATAFIPGLNVLGSIAAGAGAGGISAAMKDQNILKGALLGGATAGLVNAPILPGGGSIAQSLRGGLQGAGAGTMPSIEAALADVGSQLAGTSVFGLPAAATTAGTLAAAAAPAAASGLLSEVAPIVVTGAKTGIDLGTLATVLGAPTAAGLANLANSVSSFQPPVQSTTPPPAAPPTTPVEEIVVEATKKPPLDIFDIMTLPASTTLAPNTSNITEPSTLQPEAKSSNLLNDIMKYYTLGSGVLDMLGVGQGGGGTATMGASGTANLGVLPTFGRGAFTPYQGDYEQYGFGPEFNFFGGAKNG